MRVFTADTNSGGADRQLIRSVNESFLAWWLSDARVRGGDGGVDALALTLDSPSLRRLSSIPILLMDIDFGDEPLWEAWLHQLHPLVDVTREAEPSPICVARQALTLSWYFAREEARGNLALLGIPSNLARKLAKLDLNELEVLSRRSRARLSLRWRSHTEFWMRLLRAVADSDAKTIERLTLVAMQMLPMAHSHFIPNPQPQRHSLIS